MEKERILVLGACGQLGRELLQGLKERHGKRAVVASDRLEPAFAGLGATRYLRVDVTSRAQVELAIRMERPTQVYMLAAMLSATGEMDPLLAWRVNMEGLLNVLDCCAALGVARVFWPSSIAVFGPDSPKVGCSQSALAVPVTAYGISKRAGEYWCRYYHQRFGLDVRSLRYPGLISHGAPPGGGTTDYAVEIFYRARAGERFCCFLREDTPLPMMFMDDAVRATLELMDAPAERISVRTSYNLAAVSFTPGELAAEISRVVPGLEVSYEPDFRQGIADGWPASVNDRQAREDWGWAHRFGLREIVGEMLANVRVAGQDK